MTTEKGTLKKTKKGFQVTLPSKKGTADHNIPETAVCFRPADAEPGIEVLVERDEKNRIVKVTIPGKPEVAGAATFTPPPAARGGRDRRPQHAGRPGRTPTQGYGPPAAQPKPVGKTTKASPQILGLPFHNPYTFLPFPAAAPPRQQPTPLSIDEAPEQRGRLTGILELQVRSLAPLLTCSPCHERDDKGHKTYPALTIGPDVIVPATGIRGALRSLMMLLTGGTLGYVNQHAYLCQRRDVNLGPPGPNSPSAPKNVFLGEVVEPGTAFRPGRIQVGRASLVKAEDLRVLLNNNSSLRSKCRNYAERDDILPRKVLPERKAASIKHLWVELDGNNRPVSISDDPTAFRCPAKVKLSGRPVGSRERLRNKREGLLPSAHVTEFELPPEFWCAYSSRHAYGDRPILEKGDLVWVEPADPDAHNITTATHVRSIQWARWGKGGRLLTDRLPSYTLPDSMQNDGQVDEVTDLFGQVPLERRFNAPNFAARIRPENLVFFDAATKVERTALAPLAPPHPGCIAFYRENDDPDKISEDDTLRGYKVYRTTAEQGADAPWHYQEQGVYGDRGELKTDPQKVCKTCDLLPAGQAGQLRIAFRGLTPRELALLLQTCAVPWRLGGGKPLGLGLCAVELTRMIDEDGEPLTVPGWTIRIDEAGHICVDGWQREVADLQSRVQLWVASQQPVARLRYPRAVEENNHKKSRGGHAWFKRHASPRMVTQRGGEGRQPGLEPLHIDGPLKESAVRAGQLVDPASPLIGGQVLPTFDPQHPQDDVLYGYDGYGILLDQGGRSQYRIYTAIEPFDPSQHVTGQEESEGSHGKDAQFRKDQKRRRTEGQ